MLVNSLSPSISGFARAVRVGCPAAPPTTCRARLSRTQRKVPRLWWIKRKVCWRGRLG